MYTQALNSIRSQLAEAKTRLNGEIALYDDSFCNNLETLNVMNSALRALDEAARHLNCLSFEPEVASAGHAASIRL